MASKNEKKGHYTLIIGDDKYRVPVRLVGIIDEKACNAIVNILDPNIARKISTAEGVNIKNHFMIGKRFVIVIKEPSEAFGNEVPQAVYISPTVKSIAFIRGNKILICEEGGCKSKFEFKEEA